MPNSVEDMGDDSRRRGTARGGRTRAVASSAFTTETILDIVERLGLIDLVTARIRERLEEVDIDDMFEELARYVRRNPEVLVVALATVTVSAGLIVYLNSRNEQFGDDEAGDEVPVRVRSTPARKAAGASRR